MWLSPGALPARAGVSAGFSPRDPCRVPDQELLDVQDWADEGIIRVVFVTSPGKFISTIEGEHGIFCIEHLNDCHCSISFMLWLVTQDLGTDALMWQVSVEPPVQCLSLWMEWMNPRP